METAPEAKKTRQGVIRRTKWHRNASAKKKSNPPEKASKLASLLYSCGYNQRKICLELGISTEQYYSFIGYPEQLNVIQLQHVCYLTGKSLPEIMNKYVLNQNELSPNWFDE